MFTLSTGDVDFAEECHTAYIHGQRALDDLLWNETAKYYNAYEACCSQHPCTEQYSEEYSYLKDGTLAHVRGSHPNTPGAIMTDTFYAQVHTSPTCGHLLGTVQLHVHVQLCVI